MAGINLGKLKLGGAPTAAPPKPTEEQYDARRINTEATEPSVDQSTPKPVSDAPQRPAGIRLGGLRIGGGNPTVPADNGGGTNVQVGGGVSDSSVPAAATQGSPAVSTRVPGSPEGFQQLLDKLDSLIIAGQGISPLSLDSARAYAGQVFMELKQFPELDPILKDRDMHNIMSVVQQSTITARETIQKTKVKKETKASKAANTDFGDFDSFGDPALLPTQAQQAVAKASQVGKGLDVFASLDVSSISAKLNRERK